MGRARRALKAEASLAASSSFMGQSAAKISTSGTRTIRGARRGAVRVNAMFERYADGMMHTYLE